MIKAAIHKLMKVMLLCVALQISVVYAESNTSPPLPLSAKQIKKLQHLFPPGNGSGSTPVLSTGTLAYEHVVWQQMPIDIALPVGKERMIRFPASVQFGYDKSKLSDETLRVQNNDGTLYLLAKNAFAPERVEVKINATSKIILLNLSASKEASNTPLAIVMPSETTMHNEVSSVDNAAPVAQNPDSVSYTDLTRFAAQQLYAPQRLLTQPPDIFRTPMHTHKTIPLLRDGSVIAMPLASWRGGDRFVTAVLLRNPTKQPVTLDPRSLCGNWQAATFFPQTILAPLGNTADSTTVFLVSNRSFAEALAECTQGF